jgi:hypothetical protein
MMTDYTLNYGSNITISSPATIENFIYDGGKIRLTPNIYYYKTGDFIFNPTSSDNPEERIFNSFISRFALETGINGKFPAFKLYDLYPNAALFFPCMLFQYAPGDEPSATLFGNEFLLGLNISIELAFKRDYKINIGNNLIGEKDLAEHFLYNANQIINDIKYNSDKIKIGEIEINPKIHEPKEPNQTLYGFSMDVFIEYLPMD